MMLSAVSATVTPSHRAEKYAEYCNTHYSAQNKDELANLPGPEPTERVAIITCMDARLDVFKMFNLKPGEAHVIRNGGGRAADAVRSLMGSEQVLGTQEIMVIHHTDCGYSRAPSLDALHEELDTFLRTPTNHIPMLPIVNKGEDPVKTNDVIEAKKTSPKALASLEESVVQDVKFLQNSPYVRVKGGMATPTLSGWIYGTHEGTIRKVA